MKKLYIIDATAYIFRAYHGLRALSAPDGTPTNALYGFATMIMKILKDMESPYIAAVFDPKGPSFRKDIYHEYKANRPPAPDDLKIQIPLCIKFTELLGIPIFIKEKYEADDLIATLCRMGLEKGMEVRILSADKDLMQLVNENVTMYDSMRKKLYDSQAVEVKFGVKPELIGDLLALMGDSSDNIPGIPGVGPKTGAKLLNQFGDLKSVLANSDSLKGKLGEKVKNGVDSANLSRVLVTLDENVEIEGDVKEITTYNYKYNMALIPFFRTLGFSRFVDQIKDIFGTEGIPVNENKKVVERKTVSSMDELKKLEFKEKLAVSFIQEGNDYHVGDVLGIGLYGGDVSYYLPIGFGLLRVGLDVKDVFDFLKPVLEDETIEKYLYQHKILLLVLHKYGIKLKGKIKDPLICSYLWDASRDNHSLETICALDSGEDLKSCAVAMGKGKSGKHFSELSQDEAMECLTNEAIAIFDTGEIIFNKMEKSGKLGEIYEDIELPLTRVLMEIEKNGVMIDSKFLYDLGLQIKKELTKIETEVEEFAGYSLNMGSPKQLQKLLFEDIGLTPQKKTKTGYSTDAHVLEQLAMVHPIPAQIQNHRVLSKLKSTYIDALPKLVNPVTKRIHARFNQAVAATGRLSSSEPNLQNIPIRTALGRRIREAFIARKGFLLVSLDYSQIELRVLAHLSKDETLIDAYAHNKDIHSITAGEIFDIPVDEVDSDQRRVAKGVNFGVVYGQTGWGLAQAIGIPMGEAKHYIDKYFEKYPGIKTYMDGLIEETKQKGYVETMFGRTRKFVFVKRNRMMIERMVKNTPIQGTAADIMKLAMIECDKKLKKLFPKAQMTLSVHDELTFEVPQKQVGDFSFKAKEIMENVCELGVPLKVEFSYGKNWSDAH
jgi:DNA polymerase I